VQAAPGEYDWGVDEKLRELERRWKETGTVEDEAAHLLERVRLGLLAERRLVAAAALGHPGAQAAVGPQPDVSPRDAVLQLEGDDARLWASDCAEHVVWIWEELCPVESHGNDMRVLIDGVRDRAVGDLSTSDLRELAQQATRTLQSAWREHFPAKLALGLAGCAAGSSVTCCAEPDPVEAARSASKQALDAIRQVPREDLDVASEEAWQRRKLVEYLLAERSDSGPD
jgi:hypothetical protein